jgi:ABC-type polysaccharide transport system permease subunit
MNVNKLLKSTRSDTGWNEKETLRRHIWRNKEFYLMLVPGILYFFIFKILPLFG